MNYCVHCSCLILSMLVPSDVLVIGMGWTLEVWIVSVVVVYLAEVTIETLVFNEWLTWLFVHVGTYIGSLHTALTFISMRHFKVSQFIFHSWHLSNAINTWDALSTILINCIFCYLGQIPTLIVGIYRILCEVVRTSVTKLRFRALKLYMMGSILVLLTKWTVSECVWISNWFNCAFALSSRKWTVLWIWHLSDLVKVGNTCCCNSCLFLCT